MSIREGVIISFSELRRKELLRELKEDDSFSSFSDALDILETRIKEKEVSILSFSEHTLDFLCISTKGNKVVTGKHRVEFSNFVSLDSLFIKEVEKLIDEDISLLILKASQGRGQKVPIKKWTKIINALHTLRPLLMSEIDRILMLKKMSYYTLRGSTAELLLQEREALGISLDIFEGASDLRKAALGGWAPSENDIEDESKADKDLNLNMLADRESSFLSGVPSRFIQEETAIQHDLCNWGGISAENVGGLAHFEKGDRTLDVIYANRNALEKTTGVDLIYFNQRYNSFILVQYKLMKDEAGKARYRPDKQLYEELKRMDAFHLKYQTSSPIVSNAEYRINNDGFLLKFVPNKGLKPASSELIKGMYIPREYMQFLLSSGGPKGERGGKVIEFDNVPRYITNSEFVSFVGRGWIGTNNIHSKSLESLIGTFLETGNATLIAVENFQLEQKKS